MPYTGDIPPTPTPNPCASPEGVGQPDYNPCNYWPYHTAPWQQFNAMGSAYDDWIRGREQAMPKTFVPALVKALLYINRYAARHASTLNAQLTAGQYASLQRILTEIDDNFVSITYREQP